MLYYSSNQVLYTLSFLYFKYNKYVIYMLCIALCFLYLTRLGVHPILVPPVYSRVVFHCVDLPQFI